MASANERLRDAAEEGDVAGIADALLAGADPNAFEGTDDWTPLLSAADICQVAAIAALLAAGARVDGTTRSGSTPLMQAAVAGQTAAVNALLAAGADVQRADTLGQTALHWASEAGRLHAARLLLDAGARTDVRNKHGKRPIDEVRAQLARSLDASARSHHAAALSRCGAQVCAWVSDKSNEAALTALLTSAAPWSRRRPVALACYGDAWEWEA
jgi:ankyrin repeat protein